MLGRVPFMRVLVVEDDRKVAGFIQMGLREEGYAVDVARDGEEATTLAHVNEYDAILLDIMLPRKNGLQVAAELRREGRKTPILMLTARDTTEDVVRGLDAGADDYLAKPFRFDELLARLRALIRRGGSTRLERLTYSTLEMNRMKHQARASGKVLDLTPREFQLLEHFMLHPEEVVRRTELLEKVGVVVTPGIGYGKNGEGYVRLSLTLPDAGVVKGLSRLAEWHAKK